MDLPEDGATVAQIIDLEDGDVKTESIGDVTDAVNVKVLWSTDGDSQLGTFEIVQESVSEAKSPEDDPSLARGDMGHVGDQMLHHVEVEHGLVGHADLTHQQVSEENNIMNSDDMSESHMLHVPENDGSILSDSPSTIQVATSLATELTANSDQDVIQLLLPTTDEVYSPSTGVPRGEPLTDTAH